MDYNLNPKYQNVGIARGGEIAVNLQSNKKTPNLIFRPFNLFKYNRYIIGEFKCTVFPIQMYKKV